MKCLAFFSEQAQKSWASLAMRVVAIVFHQLPGNSCSPAIVTTGFVGRLCKLNRAHTFKDWGL